MNERLQAPLRERLLARVDHAITHLAGDTVIRYPLGEKTVEVHQRNKGQIDFHLPDNSTTIFSWGDPVHVEKDGVLLKRSRISSGSYPPGAKQTEYKPLLYSSVGQPVDNSRYRKSVAVKKENNENNEQPTTPRTQVPREESYEDFIRRISSSF